MAVTPIQIALMFVSLRVLVEFRHPCTVRSAYLGNVGLALPSARFDRFARGGARREPSVGVGVALDFTVAHPEHVSDALATAVICALWSGRARTIPKLVALTRTNRWFAGSLRGQEPKALLARVRALVAEG